MSRRRHERRLDPGPDVLFHKVALQTLFEAMISLKERDLEAAGRMAERLAKLTRTPR
ncbi:hypothetical protein RMQ97_12100 [Maricaulis sp. D1M11]|uniref:hypothetical protein n=1 Tax=Maricaulis sp. D1M11 TaxID=3076117 RepID=UPI0039B5C883